MDVRTLAFLGMHIKWNWLYFVLHRSSLSEVSTSNIKVAGITCDCAKILQIVMPLNAKRISLGDPS